jgi:hypothetical protein
VELVLADPFYDYFAFPIAPLTLGLQITGLLLPDRRWRLTLGVVCPVAIAAMTYAVFTIPGPEDGVNLGAPFMALWASGSAVVFGAAVLREAGTSLVQRRRPSAGPS